MKHTTAMAAALTIFISPMTRLNAAVPAAEAAQLGAKLTPFGAEKAGNADGSIPAYTGGLTSPPAGYEPGSGHSPDPFAAEKPLLSITPANVDKYAASLTAGTVAMLRKYPTFRVDVYPTHRTAPIPAWVAENTRKNATQAQMIDVANGDGVNGAYGGIPFPIPKTGAEIIWNYYLHWQPASVIKRAPSYLVDASGHATMLGDFTILYADLFYDRKETALPDTYFFRQVSHGNAPSSQVGYNLILTYSIDYADADQLTWIYTLGQRRVRTAPEFAYDTPVANFDGALTYDEVSMYGGRLDRFDFKIAGKKEIYVPYNDYKANASETKTASLLTPNHPNPDDVRWEKHRVWVVESTLKPGKRHILSRRTFYVDEDSWLIVATDGYDHAGNLYRVGLDLSFVLYDKEVPYTVPDFFFLADLTKGEYFIHMVSDGFMRSSGTLPDLGQFTPSRLAATGVR